MNREGTFNIVVAGFPYNEINSIVDVLAETAVENGISCTGTSLNTRDTFGLRTSSYQLRLGENAKACYIPVGEGDLLLGLEAGAAARAAAEVMGGHGIAVINTWQYHPPLLVKYPSVEEVFEMLGRLVAAVVPVDGIHLGEEAGSRKIADGLVDMAMFGALCGTGRLPFPTDDVERVLASRYRSDEGEGVLKAFRLGVEATAGAVLPGLAAVGGASA